MPRISVVLPIYGTAQYLQELHRRLVNVLEPLGGDFELIMVDDGSPDNAWAIIAELAARDRRVKGIRLSRNFGQHPALSAGFENASGDIIVQMDSDLQNRPEDIPLMLQQLSDDIDVVYTMRAGSRESFLNKLTSRIFNRVFAMITGADVPPNIGAFRLFTRRFLTAIQRYQERNVLWGPLMFHAGFKSAKVSVRHDERHGSGSSYSFFKRLNLAINALLSYTDLPHRFLMWFGMLVLTMSVLYSLAMVGQYLVFGRQLLPGLTLIALLIVMSLGATMTGLGIIGMYVFRVYQEVLLRPRFLVARTVNIDAQSFGARDRHAGPCP